MTEIRKRRIISTCVCVCEEVKNLDYPIKYIHAASAVKQEDNMIM